MPSLTSRRSGLPREKSQKLTGKKRNETCYKGLLLRRSLGLVHIIFPSEEAEENTLLTIFYHVRSTTKYRVIQENGVQDRLCVRESTWCT